MPTLHFSIGENLGITLAEIARDHIYKMDVDKALTVWEDAFGCPKNMLNRLTTGELVVKVDDPEKCLISVCKRSELDPERQNEYPLLTRKDIVGLIQKNFRDAVDEDNDENWDHFCLEISEVTRMISDNDKMEIPGSLYGKFLQNIPGVTATVELTIPARYAAKAILDSKPGDFESELEKLVGDLNEGYSGNRFMKETGMHKFYKIIRVMRHCLEILENKKKIARMLDFLNESFPDDKDAEYSKATSDLYMQMTNKMLRYKFEHVWMPAITDFIAGVMSCANKPEEASIPDTNEVTREFGSKKMKGDLLDQYLESQKNIDKALDNFKPVDITQGFDAGWIAPDGTCFALNGTVGNDLHIQLADEIMKLYKFKKPESIKDYSDDYFLAAVKGFVKFHHKWITFEGYDCIRTSKPVPMTKNQIEAICKYGRSCYDGYLDFGYMKKSIHVDLFKNASQYTLEQIFKA